MKTKVSKILFVDDSPDSLKLMIDTVLEADMNVDYLTAVNGKSAVEISATETPDLIIMDWEMPLMSGVEAVVNIRKCEKLSHIPIIITSGVMLSTENLKTALDAGATDYIRKPFEKVELIARINAQLSFGNLLKTTIKQNELLLQKENELKHRITEQKKTIELNEQMLTSNAIKSGHYSNTLKKIKTTIDDIFNSIDTNSIEARNKRNAAISLINTELNNNNWNDFEQRFLAANPEFYKSLIGDFPTLKPNDLLLCALISLNIDYKEIAFILNITPESAKTIRKRLRKKLSLLPDENLTLFLLKYKSK